MSATRIEITLFKDRTKRGYLTVYDAVEGECIAEYPCLGCADKGRAKAEGNAGGSPLYPYGDTPTGEYAKASIVKLPEDAAGGRLGQYWITLEPKGGDALQAKQNGRWGIGIHGGRGNDRLVPTYGCVRMLDSDIAELFTIAKGDRFTIKIEEERRDQ